MNLCLDAVRRAPSKQNEYITEEKLKELHRAGRATQNGTHEMFQQCLLQKGLCRAAQSWKVLGERIRKGQTLFKVT